MALKDATKYIALAVAAIIAFIMVGTYLVFKVRREEEKEKEREQRAAGVDADSASKKPVVRKRIGETDAYQGRGSIYHMHPLLHYSARVSVLLNSNKSKSHEYNFQNLS